ncbi:MAG: metallophosphoesterase family protein [Hyphomonas sp.]
MSEKLYVAIGDIHGELQRLKSLHQLARAHAAQFHPNLKLVFVHLGDLVDRGPNSCGVIEYLMNLHEQSPETVTLKGNHEELMLDSYPNGEAYLDRAWLDWGGKETLSSYAERDLEHPPKDHLDWISALPHIVDDAARKLIFVHAGVHPEHYPKCSAQLHLWTRRRDFFNPEHWVANQLQGVTIVHGHTPTKDDKPDVAEFDGRRRINVDTGAVYGGVLTAVVLAPNEKEVFLYA